MKKLFFLLCMVMMMCTALLPSTQVFAANYEMEYIINPVTEVSSTSALIQGYIYPGRTLDNNIAIPGYVYEIHIWETSAPSTKRRVYINRAGGTSGGPVYNFIDGLKPDTEYTFTFFTPMRMIPAEGYPAELTFKTAPSQSLIKGNVNGDGTVDSQDYDILIDIILKKANFADENAKLAADVSGDGKVRVNDVTLLRRLILAL